MERSIALLRGINLGSHNRLAMPALREALEARGLKHVSTYLQSGNVVFETAERPQAALVRDICAWLHEEFGYEIAVSIITSQKLAAVVEANPFLERAGINQAKLHATFLAEMPSAESVASIPSGRGGDDQWRIIGTTIYLYCPNGYGRTKLTNAFFERKLGVSATTRNWKTVLALAELATA